MGKGIVLLNINGFLMSPFNEPRHFVVADLLNCIQV